MSFAIIKEVKLIINMFQYKIRENILPSQMSLFHGGSLEGHITKKTTKQVRYYGTDVTAWCVSKMHKCALKVRVHQKIT